MDFATRYITRLPAASCKQGSWFYAKLTYLETIYCRQRLLQTAATPSIYWTWYRAVFICSTRCRPCTKKHPADSVSLNIARFLWRRKYHKIKNSTWCHGPTVSSNIRKKSISLQSPFFCADIIAANILYAITKKRRDRFRPNAADRQERIKSPSKAIIHSSWEVK